MINVYLSKKTFYAQKFELVGTLETTYSQKTRFVDPKLEKLIGMEGNFETRKLQTFLYKRPKTHENTSSRHISASVWS